MSTLFSSLLIAHVITGLLGSIFSYLVVLTLLSKEVKIKKLRAAALAAYVSYFASWLSGGYYYWFYYGAHVKPLIKGGQYPWAHTIVMEAKEHVFFLLPTLTFVTMIIAFFGANRLSTDVSFKSKVTVLSLVTLTLAIAVTLSGILISGGAR